ncbi:CPLD26 [Auxenochlorella protothecoides x Auxenochlorella symbiontica]
MASPAPWEGQVLQALEANKELRHSTYYQIATVSPSGRPSNRTVVFRGFLPGSKLSFVTDHRSSKIQDLASNPWTEAAWYLPVTREQFRFSGSAVVVSASTQEKELQQARDRAWAKMSPPGRQQFFQLAPGHARTQEDLTEDSEASVDSDVPPDTFDLVFLEVEAVDYVDLVGNTRRQWHVMEGEWMSGEVNP